MDKMDNLVPPESRDSKAYLRMIESVIGIKVLDMNIAEDAESKIKILSSLERSFPCMIITSMEIAEIDRRIFCSN